MELFDAGSEQVVLTIPNCHSKSITTIRINEAPKSSHATSLCDTFLTSTNSVTDPLKLWDLRSAKCVHRKVLTASIKNSLHNQHNSNSFLIRCILRIADFNAMKVFVPTSRPALSPCSRYIASGFEENTVSESRIKSLLK